MRMERKMQTNRRRPGARHWRALAIGLVWACAAAVWSPGALAAAEEPAGGGKAVRIGVVRLQEIVERYNRYIYITARFSEDFKTLYNRELKVLEGIEKELKLQDEEQEDMVQMLLDEAAFKAFLAKGAQLHSKEIDAQLILRDTRKLKQDLNTLMSLVTMEDIVDAVQTAAAGRQFDYVTDYFPVENVQRKLNLNSRDQNSGLLLENLQNRAPTLYADPALDITEQVVKILNDNYTIQYGAGDKADPMLTQPLEKLTLQLKERQAAFDAAQKARKFPTLAPPIGAGYPAGVVNLQTIITTVMQQRKYAQQIEDFERQLQTLGTTYQKRNMNYKSHAQDLQKALQAGRDLPRERIDEVNKEGEELTVLMREFTALQGRGQAMNFAMSNRLFEEIVIEVRRQALAAGVKLVVATFSDEKSSLAQNVEAAMNNKNMVVWYRRQSPIDLTAQVQKALSDQYQKYQADLIQAGRTAHPFDLDKPPQEVLTDFIKLNQSFKEKQEAEDKRRFQLWHDYRKDVLKITPTADAGEAAGPGGEAVQPEPKPVNP